MSMSNTKVLSSDINRCSSLQFFIFSKVLKSIQTLYDNSFERLTSLGFKINSTMPRTFAITILLCVCTVLFTPRVSALAIGKLSNTTSYGELSNTTSYGELSNTTSYGELSNTTSYGELSNTTSYGELSNTTSYGELSNTTSYGELSNTTSYGELSNTTSYGELSNTTSYGELSNTTSYGELSNTTSYGELSNTTSYGELSNATSEEDAATSKVASSKITFYNIFGMPLAWDEVVMVINGTIYKGDDHPDAVAIGTTIQYRAVVCRYVNGKCTKSIVLRVQFKVNEPSPGDDTHLSFIWLSWQGILKAEMSHHIELIDACFDVPKESDTGLLDFEYWRSGPGLKWGELPTEKFNVLNRIC